ncbi:MAG: ribbon-helix-helix domain-containing protein [Sphingomonadaceae bacterium]|uniref:ribbon-helix-helix domain-containing protein n=1 Tax=Thermaurantiacus sp. TaxID=2820283 RepID=UPI00298EEE5A|nr:ribbon-helix-helix domain-containing protein [Thermaurantiacus sp.]MCS6987023.1 ribbon-helix-helix domain-containing protein [Sphingomonadaceae bacterium]MDW8415639.1 ribbon-helix-helix domain-containing protein [Thermaurantiacus sp.]
MLVKRSLRLQGHRTSVALEPEFWAALEGAARRRGQSVAALVAAIDAQRDRPLASAIRTFLLAEAQEPKGPRPSEPSTAARA